MRILVRVEPQAREDKVILVEDHCYKVRTTKPAREGKANSAVIDLLSDFFKVSKSSVEIVSGHRGKQKIVIIEEL